MSENKVEAEPAGESAGPIAQEQLTAQNPSESTVPEDGDALAVKEPEPATEDRTTKAEPTKTSSKEKQDSKPERYQRKDFRKQPRTNNSKFDPSVMPISDNESVIRGQVEFYFGDSNLPTDKYLWDMTDGSENKPVPIKKIHDFNRMKRFQPYEAVVDALRKSNFLVVHGEAGEETVCRKFPYSPHKPNAEREARSIYAKGFGEEKATTQFDIEAFFAEFGATNAVRLRRTPDKLFKGSVFVEFADEETAKAFLALEPKPKWEGREELKIMSKTDYMEEKDNLIKEGKMEPNESRPAWHGGRGGYKGGRGRDRGRDPDDWKKRRDEDQKSGFRNDRRDRNHGHGRGRNGRQGGRNDDGDRNDRNAQDGDKADNGQHDEASTPVENGKKREREEDSAADEAPAKKIDTKQGDNREEVSADS